MKISILGAAGIALCISAGLSFAEEGHGSVADEVIAAQQAALAAATANAGFGPQSPRDLTSTAGDNLRAFGNAPDRKAMNLCNIHFHENAEHKGGEFTTFAGNGDGHGYGTGFKYDGKLTEAELAPERRQQVSDGDGPTTKANLFCDVDECSQRACASSSRPDASKRRHCAIAWVSFSECANCKSVGITCRRRMSSMVSSSDAQTGFWTLSKTRDWLVLLRMRLIVSAASVPLHAFLTSRHAGSNT